MPSGGDRICIVIFAQSFVETKQSELLNAEDGSTTARTQRDKERHTQVQVDNRRRQLHWKYKSDDEKKSAGDKKVAGMSERERKAAGDDDDDEGDEDTFVVPSGVESTAGQMYALPIDGSLTSEDIVKVATTAVSQRLTATRSLFPEPKPLFLLSWHGPGQGGF